MVLKVSKQIKKRNVKFIEFFNHKIFKNLKTISQHIPVLLDWHYNAIAT